MRTVKYSVGIDIGMSSFKACLTAINELQEVKVKSSGSFSNNANGFARLKEWALKHIKEEAPVFFLMEATGIYYEQLAWFLHSKQLKVSVILPNKSKRYFQALGLRSKNDKIDAQGLGYMCAQQALPLWKPLTEALYTLRSLTRHQESLHKTRTSLGNQLHAIDHSMYGLKELKKSLGKTITHLEKQIALVDRQIEKLVKSDPLLKAKFNNITKIKGIGVITFATIVAETNGFELFDSQRQLISYAGYDVVENQSGNKTGKTRISKKGNAHIRRALHMPSLIAVKNNESGFGNLYERVHERTRIKMKGYVAVQKKILCLIYSLWKSDSPIDPDYCKNTSGNQEPKALFPVDSERIQKRSSATEGATQDGLPCNQSPEGLFPVIQKY